MSSIQDKGKQHAVEEIELSLSLSLNGKFGVDPNANAERIVMDAQLVRTCSMYVKNGEGGKEGEIQMIRKMAKRKRMERMGIVRAVREKIDGVGSKLIVSRNENDLLPPPPPDASLIQESDNGGSSPGCGSSEVFDPSGHHAIHAPNNSPEGISPSLPDQNEKSIAVIQRMATPNVAADSLANASKKKAFIKEMANRGWPYVFTTLDGPNHVKVEGFLQKYGPRQPVKIVCICHGAHHSPAEFLKHAGVSADAIENPLKHIVVTLPSSRSSHNL